MIAPRGYLAVAATTAALLVSAYTLELLLLLASTIAFALVAGEILLFHRTLPDAASFAAVREEWPSALSPGTDSFTESSVLFSGPAPVLASVQDLLPDALAREGAPVLPPRWWTPGTRRRLRSRLRSGARGSHVLGPVAVTLWSPRRLAWEQRMFSDTRQPVQVIPPAPISRAHRIGPALFTRVQGRLALRHRGFGSEFRSLRLYQSDDDLRHVAWRRSRPGQWYVREFEQESRQDFVLAIDVTPAMLVGVPGTNALDRAVEAASLVTAVVARSGEDRVGLATGTEQLRQFLRPSRGSRHFRLLAENLAYLRSEEGSFELPALLEGLTRRLRTNSHVLLFSSLRGSLDGLHLAHARFRHRGHHLYAFLPQEAAFYPDVAPSAGAKALAWARAEEQDRAARLQSELRAEGIPVFPYDRRGASGRVLETYTQLRAWGFA
ncbi:MAG: DUF58 domain-containing protein [Thermoplasmata archaeon]|nr:DUF58 domain-containing protein [Thermoplasmata archaeon]MCI4338006.1 DUF58 domain-containing protein [Thermoplasmata archaeon]MCI4340813.1 DUF58 domain-containing protein [Thermoplasmata archaeon]